MSSDNSYLEVALISSKSFNGVRLISSQDLPRDKYDRNPRQFVPGSRGLSRLASKDYGSKDSDGGRDRALENDKHVCVIHGGNKQVPVEVDGGAKAHSSEPMPVVDATVLDMMGLGKSAA
ncbi:hypothetical protein FRX31_020706 [Thalictrum thalictroides]|uniref:Uncharacterized protein n=1 Tax=Thalictrum thalictroides TaxID=46969 RepID=A0A7J6VZC2_THATH|nr:hypothetical protein FRX31_020706 [Thalictrum thalictroides]